jgi:hypothetical protein
LVRGRVVDHRSWSCDRDRGSSGDRERSEDHGPVGRGIAELNAEAGPLRHERHHPLGGEFSLTHLVNVCVGEVPERLSDAEWPAGEWPAEERGRYRGLCNISDVYGPDQEERVLNAFDQQGLAGIGAVAGFVDGDDGFATVDGTSGHPEIWCSVNTDGTLVRLDLTYPEYLEALLLTRRLFGWQYLYADPRDPGFGYCHPDLGPDLDFLERTFPHDDFSELRARWNVQLRGGNE